MTAPRPAEPRPPLGAVLLGGYIGGWLRMDEAWPLPVDSMRLRARGTALGCGVVALLPAHRCGVAVTAMIASYLADQSARQCGPCVFGLRAVADVLTRLAACTPDAHDLERLQTWSSELRGRGACRHPEGAAGLMLSALAALDAEFLSHATQRRCSSPGPPTEAARWMS
jgi:NADH:ubiquinone oxidoreductase subunit F (NADH-binding)